MMKAVYVLVTFVAVVALAPKLSAQTPSEPRESGVHNPFSTWSIHTPDTPVEGRSPYLVGVLTPSKPIVVRRLEAVSNKGPYAGYSLPSDEPRPCPAQYALELTNGTTTHTVPIWNNFMGSKTFQTYTDSGPVNLPFDAGSRITLSMVAPKPQFPPVNCFILGLSISIQYESADDVPSKTASASLDR